MVRSTLIAALLASSVAVPVWAETTESQSNVLCSTPPEQCAQAQQTTDTTKRKIKVLRYWSFGVLH